MAAEWVGPTIEFGREVLTRGGWPAAVALSVVGLAIVAVLYLRFAPAVAGAKTEGQQVTFQGTLLKELQARAERELHLIARVETLIGINADLKAEVRVLSTGLDLARSQLRRIAEMVRDVREGRVQPGDLDLTGIEGGEA